MPETLDVYREMKQFVDFTDETAALLVKLAPMVEKRGDAITNRSTIGWAPTPRSPR